MNILMVTTFYPPHVGGIEYHVENLSRQLAKKGHKITILTSASSTQKLPSISCLNGIDIVKLKTFFPLGRIYPSLSSQGFSLNVQDVIKRLKKDKEIDIVHTHGHHYYLTWRAIVAAKKFNVPSVLTLHGLYALDPSNRIGKLQEDMFNRTIFRQELMAVNAFIGLTPRISNYARGFSSVSKNYTIPNGVDYQLFNKNAKNRNAYRNKYGIGEDKIVILFRGRFAPVKGVCELAEAAKIVAQEEKRAFFVFVGDGPLKADLVKTLQPIAASCLVTGWSPAHEIHELYLASDIFVLPSRSEALPITILEAMAARLKILATPVGGIPDVLNTYSPKAFIKSLNSTEIARQINSIAKLKNDIIIPQNGCVINALLDWDKVADRIEEVYRNVLRVEEAHGLE